MLVQAQVVPWWGTGRPAEFSLSGCHPVTGIAHRQEDSGVRLQNGGDSVTASITHAFAKLEIRIFWCPLPWGSECSGNYQPRGNGKTARESARQIPACSSLPGTESPREIWLGRSNRSRADLAGSWTTRVQARRVPADPTADRKPKACQCSPSRSHPVTGIAYRQEEGGYDYKTEAIRQPRADNYTHFREMKFRKFSLEPGWICSDSVEQIGSADPSVPPVPRTEVRWRSGSADPTAPEQVWQAPGLREFRLAESQQILPLIGNRKPASDRTHWIQ